MNDKYKERITKLFADFKKYAPDLVIEFIGDCGNKYLVTLTRKTLPKGEFILDAYYTWDKGTGTIDPISIAANRDLRKRAESHVVYRRK